MKKRMITILVVVLMLGALAGSAGVGAQDEFTLLIWADETRAGVINDLSADFSDEFGVAIEVQQIGFGDIRDQFVISGPAGEGPDLLIGAHDWLGEFVVSGLVAPLDLSAVEEDFVPATLDAFTFEGEVYGLPYALENVAFFYNTDLIDTPPTTWDEVRSLSEELVENGDVEFGYAIQENDPFHAFGIQTAFGGYVFAFEEGVGYDPSDIGIDSDGTIAAFTWLDGMVEDGLTPDGLDYDSMHVLFESGDAAMIISGPWALPRIEESGVNFGIANIPDGPAGEASPFLGVQGFMVSAFSENSELAQLFLTEFVATDDVMFALFEAGQRPPAFVPSLEGLDDENLLAFGEAGQNGLAMPAIPEMGAVWESWGNAMQLVIQQQQEPADAFADAAEQIRAAIAGE